MEKNTSTHPGKSRQSVTIWFLSIASIVGIAIWGFWPWPMGVNGSDGNSVTYLDQGWDSGLREAFYYTPQGSRLMPYKWFLALEQAGNEQRFSNPDNFAGYGYLLPSDGPSTLNPDGLPVGFVKGEFDEPRLGQWLGLTCAACHTNDVSYQGHTIRIDGAPALADLHSFLSELAAAIAATRLDKPKFARFAANVFGHVPTPDEAAQLFQDFSEYAVAMEGDIWMRTPPLAAGPARTDALGQIINTLAVSNLHEPDNLRPISAPVSYPFLWYTPDLEWVQWVPIANNPIARNAGEALGVFGVADFTVGGDERFKSSVMFRNLFELEGWVDDLKPPPWPEDIFGPVSAELAAKGAKLFRTHCLACHNMPPFRMSPKGRYFDPDKQFIKITAVKYTSVGTDDQYTLDLIRRTTRTGPLKDSLFGVMPVIGSECGPDSPPQALEVVPGGKYFTATVGAVVIKGLSDLHLAPAERMAYVDYRVCPMVEGDQAPKPYMPRKDQAMRLKAGPLVGIWATGPFLHNGSVPNIYELLSPPKERSSVFWVGNRELDIDKLGYVSEEGPGLFRFDTSLPGNGNMGHEYPRKGALTHEERMAVIEFLKKPTPLRLKAETE